METAARIAIGDLAKRTNTNVETVRYHERAALLPAPARSLAGYRLYGIDHVKRLTFIRRARALGFSIDEVRTLLRLADGTRAPCPVIEALYRDTATPVVKPIPPLDLQRAERVGSCRSVSR